MTSVANMSWAGFQVPELRVAGLALVAVLCVGSAGCDAHPGTTAEPPAATHVLEPGHVAGERTLMGTRFAIQVVDDDEEAAAQAIVAALDEVARVEARISCWREDSETSALNRAAGSDGVAIGEDLLAVLSRAEDIASTTHGAFDITFAACGGLWDYDAGRVPGDEELRACLSSVGYEGLLLDRRASTARLARPGMRVGLGGIGKGYGIDRAAEVLKARGFENYVVDGGGDVRISGTRHGEPWRVGIAHPRHHGALYGKLTVAEGAIVTSGDYERFFERDGIRYHHILDPRTAKPARGAIAVTVLASTAMDADALATGFFVLGAEASLRLAASLPGVEVLVIDESLAVRKTPGFPPFTVVEPL